MRNDYDSVEIFAKITTALMKEVICFMKLYCTFVTYEEIEITINRMRWSGIEAEFIKRINILEKMYCHVKRLCPMRVIPVYGIFTHVTWEQWNNYVNDWNLIPTGKEP